MCPSVLDDDSVLTYNHQFCEEHSDSSQFEDDKVTSNPFINRQENEPKKQKQCKKRRKDKNDDHIETYSDVYYQIYSTINLNDKSSLKLKLFKKKEQQKLKPKRKMSAKYDDYNMMSPSKWSLFKSKVMSISTLFVRNTKPEAIKKLRPERFEPEKNLPPCKPYCDRCERREYLEPDKILPTCQPYCSHCERRHSKKKKTQPLPVFYVQEEKVPLKISPKSIKSPVHSTNTLTNYWRNYSSSSETDIKLGRKPKRAMTKTNLLDPSNQEVIRTRRNSVYNVPPYSQTCPYCNNSRLVQKTIPVFQIDEEVICDNLSAKYLSEVFQDVEKKYQRERFEDNILVNDCQNQSIKFVGGCCRTIHKSPKETGSQTLSAGIHLKNESTDPHQCDFTEQNQNDTVARNDNNLHNDDRSPPSPHSHAYACCPHGSKDRPCQHPHNLVQKAVENKYNGEILCIHSPPCVLINGCLNLPSYKPKSPDVPVYTTQERMGSIFKKFYSRSKITSDQSCQHQLPGRSVQECQTSICRVNKIIQSICHHDPPCSYVRGCCRPRTEFICESCIHIPMCPRVNETRQLNQHVIETNYAKYPTNYKIPELTTQNTGTVTQERQKHYIALTARENICIQVSKNSDPTEDLCVHVPICQKQSVPICCVENEIIKFQRCNDDLQSIYESEMPISSMEYYDFPVRDNNKVHMNTNYNANVKIYDNASVSSKTPTFANSIKVAELTDVKGLKTISEGPTVNSSKQNVNQFIKPPTKQEHGVLVKPSQEKKDDYCVHVPMCQKVPKCIIKSKKQKQNKQSKKTKVMDTTNEARKNYVALTPRDDICIQTVIKTDAKYVCRHQPPCVKIPKCLGEVVKDSLIPLEDIPDCTHNPFCELIPACCRKPKSDLKSVASQFPASCRIT